MKKIAFLSTLLLATAPAVFAAQKQSTKQDNDYAANLKAIHLATSNTLATLKHKAECGNLPAILAWIEFDKLLNSEYRRPMNIHNVAATNMLTELGLVDNLGYINPLVLEALRSEGKLVNQKDLPGQVDPE